MEEFGLLGVLGIILGVLGVIVLLTGKRPTYSSPTKSDATQK